MKTLIVILGLYSVFATFMWLRPTDSETAEKAVEVIDRKTDRKADDLNLTEVNTKRLETIKDSVRTRYVNDHGIPGNRGDFIFVEDEKELERQKLLADIDCYNRVAVGDEFMKKELPSMLDAEYKKGMKEGLVIGIPIGVAIGVITVKLLGGL